MTLSLVLKYMLKYHGILSFSSILSDVDAIRSFYKDHFSHARDPDYTCCGEALEGKALV